jgi:2-methylcitrate dehydratase PrpD
MSDVSETAAAHRPADTSGATWQFARYATNAKFADFPPAVVAQGVRAFVNWAGCVLGASHHVAVTFAHDALDRYSGPEEATVLGTGARFNMMQAALFNSMAASARVFDDTYLSTVVHPTSPVAAASLAVAEHLRLSGEALLTALILGDEISCRASNMIAKPPAKSHLGLYMTSIAAGIGAAVAAAKLMKLSERETVWAIGIAVSQASGVRIMHGSRTTPLMAGTTARVGIQAALLARAGMTSNEKVLEGTRGFADVFSSPTNIAAATDSLGEKFEFLDLAYKPYPCGIVAHAIVDACLQLAKEHDIDAAKIERVEVEVCPAGIELTGVRHPVDHMNCRNSLHHWAAVSLMYRRATILEEEVIHDPAVKAFRDRIQADAVDMPPDAARVRLVMKDGKILDKFVEHCVGSRDGPMNDAEIDEKFMGQALLDMSDAQAKAALAACREILSAADVSRTVKTLVV